MKITGVECIPVTLPYKKPMKIGKHTSPASESVVVKIHTDEGITGIGESGHGLGVELNEKLLPRLITPGKSPTMIFL